MAARLAKYGHSVLLVEAGDDQTDSYQYRVPALSLQASEYVPMAWNYFVTHYNDAERQKKDTKMTWFTPEEQFYVGNDPPRGSYPYGILYPRSGTFGGCTAHNALIAVLPDDADWQTIVNITGDKSWAPQKMKKFFTRLERNRYLSTSTGGHGYDGWLTISITNVGLGFMPFDVKIVNIIMGAAASVGQKARGAVTTLKGLMSVIARDLNSDVRDQDRGQGLFQMPLSIRDGVRSGPRDFIMEVMEEKDKNGKAKYHLDVLLNTFVTKILFDHNRCSSAKPRAIGVEYASGQSLYRADPRAPSAKESKPLKPDGKVLARREVIISAGTFNTPQLLKLSGIGPRRELKRLDIPVVVHSPGVGRNMQDRYETTLISRNEESFKLTEKCSWMKKNPDTCLEKWKKSSPVAFRGPYTSGGIALALIRRSSVSAYETPDLFLAGAPAMFKGYPLGYADESFKSSHYWSWLVLKAHTRNAAGTVLLRSKDPRDTPVISFNSFEEGTNDRHQADLDAKALVEGMMWARKSIKSIPQVPKPFEEVWPGNRANSSKEMTEWVKNEAWGHHACCTAPIGADDDDMAVLDSKFRVRGVDNLRVVDASVFPRIPGYFIVLPIYIMSEKAADTIHADTR